MEPLDQRMARYQDIVAARDRGLTCAQIGGLFEPPMTRQRVWTILRNGPPRKNGRPPKAK